MARNYLQASREKSQEESWQFSLRNVLWWALTTAFALAAWLTLSLHGTTTISRLAALSASFSGLAYSIEHGLRLWPVKKAWRYRLAFLLPALLGVTGVVLLVEPHRLRSLLPATILLFAFLGSLAATTVKEKIYENNSPPPDWISQEVEAFHQRAIGQPAKAASLKRGFDICLAALGLFISIPIWLIIIFLIWLEDPGPLLFVKNSVGKGGKTFHQFKFRTMVSGAEEHTGPILSSHGDKRILRTGRFLRKTALDELPQLINILAGDMSFVGPRPQRTVLVHSYLSAVPGYAERHRVSPGLAGLAQVAGDYYLTPRQKLRFDRLYIAYASLEFDLKLLLLAFLITFWYRWKKDWNGRLPRRWLHPGHQRNNL